MDDPIWYFPPSYVELQHFAAYSNLTIFAAELCNGHILLCEVVDIDSGTVLAEAVYNGDSGSLISANIYKA